MENRFTELTNTFNMAKYYPESQIQTNLYSNNSYQKVSDGTYYTGPYWRTSKGKYYTGATPDFIQSEELIPALNSKPAGTDATQPDFVPEPYIPNLIGRTLPAYYLPAPTPEDYKAGSFLRYFYRRINQPIFVEISKEDYNALKQQDSKYDWAVTNPFTVLWTITGDKRHVEKTNQNVVLIIQQRALNNLRGLTTYFQGNYLKFYKE